MSKKNKAEKQNNKFGSFPLTFSSIYQHTSTFNFFFFKEKELYNIESF